MKWFTLAVVLLVLAGCGGGGDKAEKPQGYVSRAERAGAAILGAFHSLETRREPASSVCAKFGRPDDRPESGRSVGAAL
jgi:hypothetical protein